MTVEELMRKLSNCDKNLQVRIVDAASGAVYTQIDACGELRRDAIEDVRKVARGESVEDSIAAEIVLNMI